MYAGEVLPKVICRFGMLAEVPVFDKRLAHYGKDMEGIIRMHQFDKLEMEIFNTFKRVVTSTCY